MHYIIYLIHFIVGAVGVFVGHVITKAHMLAVTAEKDALKVAAVVESDAKKVEQHL